MKVTVVGSHLCPDTLYALHQLAAAGAEIDFKDIDVYKRQYKTVVLGIILMVS